MPEGVSVRQRVVWYLVVAGLLGGLVAHRWLPPAGRELAGEPEASTAPQPLLEVPALAANEVNFLARQPKPPSFFTCLQTLDEIAEYERARSLAPTDIDQSRELELAYHSARTRWSEQHRRLRARSNEQLFIEWLARTPDGPARQRLFTQLDVDRPASTY